MLKQPSFLKTMINNLIDDIIPQGVAGPITDRPEGVSTAEGRDGHEDEMAQLRKQRQTLWKVPYILVYKSTRV